MSFLIQGGIENPISQAAQLLGELRPLHIADVASAETLAPDLELTSAVVLSVENQATLASVGNLIAADPDPVSALPLAGIAVEGLIGVGQTVSILITSTDTGPPVTPVVVTPSVGGGRRRRKPPTVPASPPAHSWVGVPGKRQRFERGVPISVEATLAEPVPVASAPRAVVAPLPAWSEGVGTLGVSLSPAVEPMLETSGIPALAGDPDDEDLWLLGLL